MHGSADDRLTYFNPRQEIEKHTTVLPHWEQPGKTYIVTFRLGDSIPLVTLDQWKIEIAHWMEIHPKPWSVEEEAEYHRRFSTRMERWLDRGHGACLLRDPAAANVVGDAIHYFAGERCEVHSFVIMPNHVHAMFTPLNDWTLSSLLHSWKSFTSHSIRKMSGTEGDVWQRDYYDRMIRDSSHFWNCARYIRKNPRRAGLKPDEHVLFEAEWVMKVLDSDGVR